MVSIGLSISEYFLSKQLLESDSYIIVSFEAIGTDFKEMNFEQFLQKIVYRKHSFVGRLSRLLKIDFAAIDRLIPRLAEGGVVFILNIHENDLKRIESVFYNQSQMVAKVMYINFINLNFYVCIDLKCTHMHCIQKLKS